MKRLTAIFVCIIVLFTVRVEAAFVYGFEVFNNAAYMNISDLGLTVEVADTNLNSNLGNDLISFKFQNSGVFKSSITHVYFDSNILKSIGSITSSGLGVSFSQGANPVELPSASILTPNFETTLDLSADADPQPDGVVNNGVNAADEWLEIIFELTSAKTIADVTQLLNANNSIDGDDLRIGLKLQALPNGDSASAVSTPEPATITLFGLSGLVLMRKKRR